MSFYLSDKDYKNMMGMLYGDNKDSESSSYYLGATESAKPQQQGLVADTVDAVQMGAWQGLGDIAHGLGALTGADWLHKVGDWAGEGADENLASMSDEMKAALNQSAFDGEGQGVRNIRWWAGNLGSLIGQNLDTALTLGVGKAATFGVKQAGKLLLKKEAAEQVGRTAVEQAAKRGIPQKYWNMVGVTATMSAMSGGSRYGQKRDEVMQMTNEQLAEIPQFSDAYYAIKESEEGQGKSIEELYEMTKSAFADKVGRDAALDPTAIATDLATNAVSGLGGGFLGLGTAAKTVKGGLLKGALIEGGTEAIQGVAEQYALNKAERDNYNPNKSLTDGMADNAINGAILGGVFGSVMGGVDSHTERRAFNNQKRTLLNYINTGNESIDEQLRNYVDTINQGAADLDDLVSASRVQSLNMMGTKQARAEQVMAEKRAQDKAQAQFEADFFGEEMKQESAEEQAPEVDPNLERALELHAILNQFHNNNFSRANEFISTPMIFANDEAKKRYVTDRAFDEVRNIAQSYGIDSSNGSIMRQWLEEYAAKVKGNDTSAPQSATPESDLQHTANIAPEYREGVIAGSADQVDVGQGHYQPFQYEVMNAAALQPTQQKNDNQFRDRDRTASQAQINQIARNLDPRKLAASPTMDMGAPLLALDGKTIIAGNGRTMAIRQAYQEGGAEGYRQFLKDNAHQFGIDSTQLDSFEHPVLVRRLTTPVDIAQVAINSNEQGGMRMSDLEQAKVDARRLPSMDTFNLGENGEINTPDNQTFIRQFIQNQPENLRNELLDSQGQLSQSGVQRMRNAMLYQAYGDSQTLSRLIENTDQGAKNVLNALTALAPKVAQVQQDIHAGVLADVGISNDIIQAVEKYNQLNAQGHKVSDYLAQEDFVGDLSPEAREILTIFDENRRSGKRIAQVLGAYFDQAQTQGNVSQADMFAEGGFDKLGSLQQAKNIDEDIRLSLNESANSDFARAVDKIAQGKRGRNDRFLNMGTTPSVLKMLGITEVKVAMRENVIDKILFDHNVSASDLKQIPAQINNPIAVMRSNPSSTNPNGLVVLTELNEVVNGKEKPVIAALQLKKSGEKLEVINIASVYGRDLDTQIRNDLSRAIYWNKTKGYQFARTVGLQLPSSLTSVDNLSAFNIKTESDLSQYLSAKNNQESSSNPEIQRAQAIINKTFGKAAQHIEVTTFANPPKDVKNLITSDVEGWFNPRTGKITIVADSIKSTKTMTKDERLQFVAWHEMAHRGINVGYNGTYDNLMSDVGRNKAVSQIADAIQTQRKGTDDLAVTNRTVAIEEAIAEIMAAHETGKWNELMERYGVDIRKGQIQSMKSWLAMTAQRIKNFLAKLFGVERAGQFSDEDVLNLVANIKKSAVGNLNKSLGSEGVRYSLSESENSDFAKAVDDVFTSNHTQIKSELVHLGTTPKDLIDSGIDNLPMFMNKQKLVKIKHEHPEMTVDLLKQIPQQLNHPVAVFKNTKPESPNNSYVVLTELYGKNGNPIIVAIHANKTEKGLEFNKVASIYGRNNAGNYIANMVRYSDVRFVNKQKARRINHTLQLLADDTLNELFSKASVVKDETSVNGENSDIRFSHSQDIQKQIDQLLISKLEQSDSSPNRLLERKKAALHISDRAWLKELMKDERLHEDLSKNPNFPSEWMNQLDLPTNTVSTQSDTNENTSSKEVKPYSDKEYLELAKRYENGDLSVEPRLREMVEQRSREHGYAVRNADEIRGWAAPSDDGLSQYERWEAIKNGEGVDYNLEDVAHGYSNQPKELFFGNAKGLIANNKESSESLSALKKAVQSMAAQIKLSGRVTNMPSVTVYRAIPNDVKALNFRNGDWVSPSKEYAISHGENALDGSYRIQKFEVPANQLWWDGNDINEWRYDDGRNLIYKNTKNNLKSNELITRNDNGEIIPLSKRFNDRSSDIRFSRAPSKQAEPYQRDLMVTHNISAEGIMHAHKMGGLPFASVAVAKQSHPLTRFGEVTLIGSRDYIDPKGANKAKVFGSDIYSPRYPRISYEYSAKDQKALFEHFKESAKEIEDSAFDYNFNQGLSDTGVRQAMLESDAVKHQFLKQHNIPYEQGYREIKSSPYASYPSVQKAIELGVTSSDLERDNSGKYDSLFREFIQDFIQQQGKNDNPLIKNTVVRAKQALKSGGNEIKLFAVRRMQSGLDYRESSSVPDRVMTLSNMRKAVERNHQAFREYVDSIANGMEAKEKIWNGTDNQGRNRYVAHTLENVVKKLKKDLRGGESFNYGMPNVRAAVTPKFKTIADIQENKHRLVSTEEFEQAKSQIDAESDALAEKLGVNSWDIYDVLWNAVDENISKAFGYADIEDTPSNRKAVSDFLSKLEAMPTEYFEGKAKDVTQFSDFAGAVVPNDMAQKAYDVLANAGLKIFTYDSSDPQSRANAIKQATNQLDELTGGEILFSRSNTVQSALELSQSAKAENEPSLVESLASRDFSGFKEKLSRAVSKADEWFADSLRPVNDWIDNIHLANQTGNTSSRDHEKRRLKDSMYTAKGKRDALNSELEQAYLKPILAKLAALSKATKKGKNPIDELTMKRMVGNWISARYAIEKNQELLHREEQTMLETERLLDNAKQSGTIAEVNRLSNAYAKAKLQYENRKADIANTDYKNKSNRFKVGVAGGWSIPEAQLIMKNTEQHISRSDLESVANMVYDLNQARLEIDRASGRYTEKEYREYKANRHYVPLTGDPNADVDTDMISGAGSSAVNIGRDKALQGRTSSEAEDAIDAVWKSVGKTTTYAGFSEFKAKIDDLYETEVSLLKDKGFSDYAAREQATANLGISKHKMQGLTRSSDNVLIRKEGGQYYEYALPDRVMAALRNDNVEHANDFLKTLSKPTGWYARGVTQWTLTFAPMNMIRDTLEKSEFIRVQKLYGKNHQLVDSRTMDKIGRATIANAFANKEIWQATKRFGFGQPLRDNVPAERLLKQLLQEGGLSTYGTYLAKTETDLVNKLKKANLPLGAKLEKAGQLVEGYNHMFDTVSSLAAYKALIDQGIDSKQAAAATLELTNFRKTGSKMRGIKALYMFSQPTVMGAANLMRYLSTRKGQLRFAAHLVGGMALYTLLRSMDDEDEGGNKMDQLGDITRYIPLPLGNGHYFKLPVGFGMQQLAWNAATNLVKGMAGDISFSEMGANMFAHAFKTFAPVSPSEISAAKFPMEKIALTVTPTMLQPLMQNVVNRSAFGSKITTNFVRDDKLKAEQSKATTAQFWKDVALDLHDSMGIDMHPEQIKNLVDGYSSALGSLKELSTILVENPNREKLGRHTRMPFVSQFIGTTNEFSIQSRYYEASEEARQLAAEYSSRKDRHQLDGWLDDKGDKKRLIQWHEMNESQIKTLRREKSALTKALREGKISAVAYERRLERYNKEASHLQGRLLYHWRNLQKLNTSIN